MIKETVSALRLTLQGENVGYVAGYSNGKNVFTLAPEYLHNEARQPLTLSHANPASLARQQARYHPYVSSHKLHPVLSNLLPEGALRDYLSQAMKVHRDNEFPLLGWLGRDLPGALIADPIEASQVPALALQQHGKIEPAVIDIPDSRAHFSLAGVQMKFSMRDQEGRYITGDRNAPGDWIIKTPSTVHPFAPLNEYTAMTLAALAGVDIPEIKLIPMSNIEALPNINLPNERYAYGIRRYDRLPDNKRVHSEDFAQILFAYAHDKYTAGSYDQIGKLLYQNSSHGQRDAVQMAIRLLVNILLANGDAHLKNWSMIYPDGRNAELSPAYDIVVTKAYIPDEVQFGLNMDKTKNWYEVSFEHFKRWAEYGDIPWRPVLYNLRATLEKARALWPAALEGSEMPENQRNVLRAHWKQLHPDFRIG
ncbi:type II toxin-antitoxin system HipA family toxin [Pseudomonas syringae]|uniref:Phosphatidylinositol kinase n=1 Tax=Pseudomonas syringae TaxID=317 RepID=A0A085VNN3_PSESX|nr:type II toxin-antitoxin system HipA family toxin [Pseudomonas syringae]KFE57046.1 phosphatidylinositol kinase [Pseudomonas syringae]